MITDQTILEMLRQDFLKLRRDYSKLNRIVMNLQSNDSYQSVIYPVNRSEYSININREAEYYCTHLHQSHDEFEDFRRSYHLDHTYLEHLQMDQNASDDREELIIASDEIWIQISLEDLDQIKDIIMITSVTDSNSDSL